MSADHCCELMDVYLKDGEGVAVTYSAKFREYSIPVLDGGSSSVILNYCPWCGENLPSSLRGKWFETLEKLNVDPHGIVPASYQSESWWKNQE